MDLKYDTDASLLFGPVIWGSTGNTVITDAFSLCCNTVAVDLFNDTTKLDITVQSGGTNDVVFVAAGYASIQLVASQLDAVGHYRLSYQYTDTLPGWEYFDVVQPEAWDATYGTLASNIVNIKAGTTSIAINVSSTLAQISVFSASTIRDLTSIAINVNSLVISTASVLRNTSSVASRLVIFNASTAIGIASTLAQISVFSASTMRDLTSIAIGVNSVAVRTLEFGSSASLASAIWGHTTSTSMLVAVHSTLSNTIAINTGVLSVASSVWDVVRASHVTVGTFGEVGSIDSMASAVWGHNIAASTIVAVKSTLSNTIYLTTLDPLENAVPGAYGVGTAGRVIGQIYVDTSSLLSNVSHLNVIAASTWTNVGTGIASVLVSTASLLVSVNSLMVDTESIMVKLASMPNAIWDEPLSQHSTVGVAGAYLYGAGAGYTPGDMAAAVWDEPLSQHSTIGIAGAYLEAAGGAADPLLNAVPGAYGVGTAGRVLGQIYVDTTSTLAGVKSVLVATTSIAISTTSLIVAVQSVLTATTSIAINVLGLTGVTLLSAIANYVWDEILTGATHNIATSAGRILRAVGGNEITSGTVVSALNNSIELAAGESSVDNYYDPGIVLIDSGAGAGQSRRIIEYNGTTKVAIVNREWRTLPVAGSTYIIFADGGFLSLNDGAVVAAGTATVTLNDVAESVDDTYVGATIGIVAGTAKGQMRVIQSYNGTTKVATVHTAWETQPAVGDAYVIVPSGRSIVAGFADGAMTTTAMDSTMDLTTAQKASVNTELLDVLNVDTFGEPGQGAPAATTTLEQKLAYIYKMLRNKIATTSALINVYNDAGDTVDQKASLTDDGTTFTRGEFGTGA
ncbi:MAG: hypothetical protein PHO67_08295 [Candidatus Omnitrophica bacterium]|nr:hypothetical protein [Candidatus Omnitrophota bacterium]